MASVTNDGNGHRRIQFIGTDGIRRAIRLGKVNQRQAEAFKVKLENLVGGAITGNVDDETSRWLAGLDDALHAKLAAVGLVTARERNATTIGAFLTDFFASAQVKASTATTYRQTERALLAFFDAGRSLRSIGAKEADQWRQKMKADGLADSTIARRVKSARQMFRLAGRWKLLTENPFTDVKAGSMSNRSRMFFITTDVTAKVLEACPDAEWRLIVSLSRYGGLRCPSEHLSLVWGDVDWEHNRLRVPSPKTEHLPGRDCRFIPLFPELSGLLLKLFDASEPGATFIITRYRGIEKNLRTQLLRILRRAGVTPWPKLFHNLRSSRQTELEETYPSHVVCSWLGNTERVAREHYLQVRDAYFERAAGTEPTAPPKPNAPGDTTVEAAHNPAQYTPERAGMDRKTDCPEMQKRPALPGVSDDYRLMPIPNMTLTGFEPVSRP